MRFPKIRRVWKISPGIRIKKSRKIYSRRKSREEEKKVERDEGIKPAV